jgi:ABC-type sulfate transport system permease subunit
MSDRTMIAFGRASFSVPRLAKRALQVLTASGLTAMAALFIIMANSLLLGRGVTPGFETWLAFIRRPDIVGAIVLTAIVTIGYLYWDKRSESGNGRR